MAVNEKLREELPEGALVFDDPSFDNSIIGTTFDGRVIYDYDQMVVEYMTDNECDEEDALNWITYNSIRSLPYVGSNAPMVVCVMG